MSTTTRLTIGRKDHGRRVDFDDFVEGEFEDDPVLYELARGIVEVTEIPGVNHGRIVGRITQHFVVHELTQLFCDYRRDNPGRIQYRAGGAECRLRIRGMESDRRPCQAVYLDSPPVETPLIWEVWVPTIVVEVVSEGGEARDYVQKAEEYLMAGVQEYWILDPADRALHVHERINDAWSISVISADATYETPLLPGLEVQPAKLLANPV
jgi:Uma2 family endonuclease